MKSTSNFTLYNGVQIPAIGFGTWQIPNGEISYNAVSFALKNGYYHIDTAYDYGNEQSVGKAIRDCGIARNEIIVTSKLPAEIKSYKLALDYFERTMKNIGLEYLDLYLIHSPYPWDDRETDYTKENIEVWKAMEEFYQSGRCRAIGVSNFRVSDLTAIMENSKIKPMANQIRFFIGNIQPEVTRFCKENEIVVEGYSPFATGRIINNKAIATLSQKYKTTVPKICIRYVLQKEVITLPKSIHPEYILQNKDIDFEITTEDMEYLDGLKDTIVI